MPSCLHLFWKQSYLAIVAAELLIGNEVGVIPEGVPLAPLLEDLQKQQKAAKLKPEALERELMVDLRQRAACFARRCCIDWPHWMCIGASWMIPAQPRHIS